MVGFRGYEGRQGRELWRRVVGDVSEALATRDDDMARRLARVLINERPATAAALAAAFAAEDADPEAAARLWPRWRELIAIDDVLERMR